MGNNFNVLQLGNWTFSNHFNETSVIGSELNKLYCKNISKLLNETVEIKLQVPLIILLVDTD